LKQALHEATQDAAPAGISVISNDQASASAMLSKFEGYPLTFGPTPIEKLSRPTSYLGGDVEIFAKKGKLQFGVGLWRE
jgi:hypothetical protein